ncbi:MAG: thiamine pyrophosphate-binding protein [Myxococcota bacterium]
MVQRKAVPAGKSKSGLRSKMLLGNFLVAYLRRAGVRHIFGLPGDLVLGLFHRFGRERGLDVVTFSHEPSVGFAADGYARSTRRVGVLCVTYGAGGHNVVNPVAGAYAEQVPLLVVSGGPGVEESQVASVHHQVKDIAGQHRIFREVTCAARVIEHPERAAEEVHEVMTAIANESRPGYLEIHRDIVEMSIPVPKHIVDWDGSFPVPKSDRRKLSEAVSDTARLIRAAKRPVMIGGVELYRARAERGFLALAEKLGVPVATTILGKGVFPMDHPQHLGIHVGPFSAKEIQARIRSADLVLALGTQLTDLNLGASRPQVSRETSVWAVSDRVNISYHSYTDVMLKDFVDALGKSALPKFRERIRYYDNLKRKTRKGGKLSINDLLVEIDDFLEQHPIYDVFAESGDMLFGGLEVRVRKGGVYFAQGYYASMGFAVPAALGSAIGGGRRPLILCGDGGFQMTGSEISQAPKLGLAPIVVLVNNSGWGIFRPVTARQDLLEIPNWPYAQLAEAFGGLGLAASSAGELNEALRTAHADSRFSIIDCTIPRSDGSPISRRYIKASMRKGQSNTPGSR